MADQTLQLWANTLNTDALTKLYQRTELSDEEFQDGFLREASISAQQLNQILYLLTQAAAVACTPFPWYTETLPDGFLLMNGQTITAAEYPNAFARYGSTLPSMPDINTDFVWVIRAS